MKWIHILHFKIVFLFIYILYIYEVFRLFDYIMPKINIDINKLDREQISKEFAIDLDILLFPTAVYIPNSRKVALNKAARVLLELKANQEFNLDKWKKINPHIENILKRINKELITDQRIIITLFNGKKEIISFNLSIIKYNETGTVYIIQFRKATNKYSVSTLSSMQTVGDEIRKLMPYLNNHGKVILKEILQNYFVENTKELISDDIIYYEKEIEIISESFPDLTHQEVILCGLLINDLDSNEISLLTKKSLNSVFVSIHRINKKLNIKDRKELVATLEKAIEGRKKEQSSSRFIDDFDI